MFQQSALASYWIYYSSPSHYIHIIPILLQQCVIYKLSIFVLRMLYSSVSLSIHEAALQMFEKSGLGK